MKKILNENGEILFKGNANEMELAFNYLTKPFHILAETMGLKMKDAYKLNATYWNDATKKSKSFILVDA